MAVVFYKQATPNGVKTKEKFAANALIPGDFAHIIAENEGSSDPGNTDSEQKTALEHIVHELLPILRIDDVLGQTNVLWE